MKAKFLSVLTAMILLLLLPFSALAAGDGYVLDNAGLLTMEEARSLQDTAASIAQTCQIDVVILTEESIGYQDPETYTDDFYDSSFGEDGIVFFLEMDNRYWLINACGRVTSLVSGSEMDAMGAQAVSFFSDGDYYQGFQIMLSMLPECLEETETGAAPQSRGLGSILLISVLIGAAAAGITLLIMRSAMNTKRRQSSASDYLVPGSYSLPVRQDIFLYSQVSKTRREQQSSSPGSRTSSSGRSHSSRGGRF